MDDVTRIDRAAKAGLNTSSRAASRGSHQGLFRRAFRSVVHFLSYKFILSRKDYSRNLRGGLSPQRAADGVSPEVLHQQRKVRVVSRHARFDRQARLRGRHRHRHPRTRGRARRRVECGRDRHQSECLAFGQRECARERSGRSRDRRVHESDGGNGSATAVRRDPLEPAQARRRAEGFDRPRLARRPRISRHQGIVRPGARPAQARTAASI